MNGHPALAYVVALQQLEERRRLGTIHEARNAPRHRSLKLGSVRPKLTKEETHVPRDV
jgi:hypothetical protein